MQLTARQHYPPEKKSLKDIHPNPRRVYIHPNPRRGHSLTEGSYQGLRVENLCHTRLERADDSCDPKLQESARGIHLTPNSNCALQVV
jgi:hypothetical protein